MLHWEKAILALSLSFVLALSPTSGTQKEFNEKEFTDATMDIVSSDGDRRSRAADYLLRAPPDARQVIVDAFKKQARQITPSLPQKIDSLTTLMSVFVTGSASTLFYKVSLAPEERTPTILNKIEDAASAAAIASACSDRLTAVYLLFGNRVIRRYSATDGTNLFACVAKWSDCERR